ncbi:MAG: IclR family transcriptional regulator domain-containing protein, partial [Burkholderiales bacterium]
LSLVSRALGRAHLAFCPPDEQKVILKLLAHSHAPDDQLAHDLPAVMAMLGETRQRGYALRSPAESSASNTLALPIFEAERVVASLGLTWFSSALSTEEAVARLYPHLRIASQKITTRLAALGKPFSLSQAKLKSPAKRQKTIA